MKKLFNRNRCTLFLLLAAAGVVPVAASAQTDQDAIMMDKNNFCTGVMYNHSSWKNYWEGTFKRNNQNLGTVSTQMISVMGNYGVSRRLNLLFGLPYIATKASAGTLHGMKGVQDLSLWVKWMPVETGLGKGVFSLYTLGGFSTPLSNYQADFLPLAIGLRSTTFSGRLLLDYQQGAFFATASGTYTRRNNITIDRTSYYTTSLHMTNKVDMPDMVSEQIRTGYRSEYLIAEAVFSNMTTLGGFDMRKNDMPFPSNKMNAAVGGLNIKYTLKQLPGLSLIANTSYVLAGRNQGQAFSWGGGIFYIIDFSRKTPNNP